MERKIGKISKYKIDLTDFEIGTRYVFEKSANQTVFVVTLNPEMIFAGDKNPKFGEILQNADFALPDGIGVVLALKINGINQKRIPGVEFAQKLIGRCSENGESIAMFGAEEEVLQKASENLEKKYPGLKIAYKRNGFYSSEEEEKIAEEISKSEAKLLAVATGCPKQEIFINKYKEKFPQMICIGLGGSFDVWSGKVKRAPKVFRLCGLEWLWRVLCSPSRIKRIFPTLPLFLFRVIMERVKKFFERKEQEEF